MQNKIIQTILGLLLVGTPASSCKKTTDYEHAPTNLITNFKVPVSDGFIYGSVNNNLNTVTVYLPFYYDLSYLEPDIEVSASAKIKEEVLPVSVMDTATRYTVTGSDGISRTYKLIISIQKAGKLTVKTNPYIDSYTPHGTLGVYGNLNTNDINKVFIYLVDKNGKSSARLDGNGSNSYGMTTSGAESSITNLYIPAGLDTGLYYVKVKVYNDSALSTTPILLKYTQPQIVIFEPKAKPGETFTLISSASIITGLKGISAVINGATYNFPIVSQTLTSVTLRMPETLAPGGYLANITVDYDGWTDWNNLIYLIVL